tara:strand:+ start:580 stop:1380 length:801 start_codon:yes stop_codon:yes gene_type:complete
MKANKKEVQVHRIPTEEPTGIWIYNGQLCFNGTYVNYHNGQKYTEIDSHQPQHLYFTSDEEPKIGDWVIVDFVQSPHGKVYKNTLCKVRSIDGLGLIVERNYGTDLQERDFAENCRKIIASTNPKLTKKVCNWVSADVQGHVECLTCGDWREEVVSKKCKQEGIAQPTQALIEAYCKQGGFDKVLVEYVRDEASMMKNIDSKGEISSWKLKVDPIHNTITTHRIVEKTYTREEVESLLFQYAEDEHAWFSTKGETDQFNAWIEENL